ncbi:transposase [Horticoccus sp. 23ND18S-11]|uniref:transposase n=1 Tax=Horticoccus sp. 23ND18S-11 TaxID=3391832 RepID=UPI0039C99ABA
MARKLRLEFGGATYHVINRGNYRRPIFQPKGAAAAFERCIDEACTRCGWRVHAFVILENHFHLALETPHPNLSEGMKYLQGTWANRFNRFRGEQGRPFQGRYKALHVEPGRALASVSHYIHLNPWRAGVEETARLGTFRWSSLWWFGRRTRPGWLVADTTLADAGGLTDTPPNWRRYRSYLGMLAEDKPAERDRKFAALCTGWAVGDDIYRDELIQRLREANTPLNQACRLGDVAGERQQFRHDLWRERLVKIARAADVSLDRLAPAKSAPEKVLLATLMTLTTDVSRRWLTEQLNMGTPASAGEFVRRFIRRGEHEKPQFKALRLLVAT